jgi:histidinol dehydrogenase
MAVETSAGRGAASGMRNAGAIFLGRHTPEAIGDYVAGTNHVLPTSRAARFAGGLGVADFLKRTTDRRLRRPRRWPGSARRRCVLAEAEGWAPMRCRSRSAS